MLDIFSDWSGSRKKIILGFSKRQIVLSWKFRKHTTQLLVIAIDFSIKISGAAFTRFQTLRLQKVFPETLKETLISYGSCQFPTLGFVVERYKAIQEFIPEQFWKIKGS